MLFSIDLIYALPKYILELAPLRPHLFLLLLGTSKFVTQTPTYALHVAFSGTLTVTVPSKSCDVVHS